MPQINWFLILKNNNKKQYYRIKKNIRIKIMYKICYQKPP